MSEEPIIIDLSKHMHPFCVENESFLQRDARKKLLGFLSEFQEQADNSYKSNKNNQHSSIFEKKSYNNTIFISGQRGSGKTTFLKTVLKQIDKQEIDDAEIQAITNNKNAELSVVPVTYFDPTTIDTNQHLLVDIIASIKNRLDYQNKSCLSDKMDTLNELLGKMAEGLKLLKSEHTANTNDSAWFLNQALKNSSGGQSLAKHFDSFVDEACKLLGTSLLIIGIDDVDTESKKAYEVLELIRSYLTSPRVVVIMTGDPKLYSHIVWGKKYTELSIKGQDSKSTTLELSDHLEQQYLSKVFPIQYRIRLKLLLDIKDIKIKENNKGEVKDIEKYFNDFFCLYFSLDEKDVAVYTQFMLSQPVRTVLQFLKAANGNLEEFNLKDVIASSFLGELYRSGLNLEGLESNGLSASTIGYEAFKLLEQYSDLETGFYFRTDANNASLNAGKFYLCAVASDYLNRKNKNKVGQALSLMLATGAVANIYITAISGDAPERQDYNKYLDYIGLNKHESFTTLLAHCSFYLKDKSNGVLALSRMTRLPKIYQDDVIYYPEERNNFAKFIAMVTILSSSYSMTNSKTTNSYCSIYCLLATLAEWLICDKRETRKLLVRMLSIQTFSSPNQFYFKEDSNNDSDEDINENDIFSNYHIYCLNYFLKNWKDNFSTQSSFSSLLVGKVWARIFYTINNISAYLQRNKKNNTSLWKTMHLYCVGILNAILIEEIRYSVSPDNIEMGMQEHIHGSFINARNVLSSGRVFYRNLSKVVDPLFLDSEHFKMGYLRDLCPLTYSLLMCPLFWPYIINDEIKESLNIKELIQDSINTSYAKNTESDTEFGEDYLHEEFFTDFSSEELESYLSNLNIDK